MNTQVQVSTGEQTAPEVRLDSEAVAPRKRQRARGATKTKTPEALASDNGHDKVAASTVIEMAKKPRRRYHHFVVGGVHEVPDGYLQKWEEIEEEDRWGNITQRRVRLKDENGFQTAVWVETGRRLVDSSQDVCFPVEKFPESPKSVWLENGVVHWSFGDGLIWWTDETGAVHFRGTRKGSKPNPPNRIEWLRPVPVDHSDRETFVAKRTEWFANLKPITEEAQNELEARKTPVPEPTEQWFVVSLPEIAMQNRFWGMGHDWDERETIPPDAREHYPEGWCCKLVQPQPSGFVLSGRGWVRWDSDATYVQFPVHYWTWDENGKPFRRTDKTGRGKGDYRVECGMKVHRWLLKPVKPTEARPIYDWLVAEYKRAVKEAKRAGQ